MFRRLRLFFLILLTLFWFFVGLPYIFVQTELGSSYLSRILTYYNKEYSIKIGVISHSLLSPFDLKLNDVIVQNKQENITYLDVESVKLTLNKHNLWQADHFSFLSLENGKINELSSVEDKNLHFDFLELKGISVSNLYFHDQSSKKNSEINLNRIYGGMAPFSLNTLKDQSNTQFNFTIEEANYHQLDSNPPVQLKSIVLQGKRENNILNLQRLAANVNDGFFILNGSIQHDNSFEINQLKLDGIHIQSDIEQNKMAQFLSAIPMITNVPSISIKSLSIINSSINTPSFKIEKANLDLKNAIYQPTLTKFKSDQETIFDVSKSNLSFNAESVVLQDEIIENPLIQWHFSENKLVIDKVLATYHQGIVTLSGQWFPDHLVIENIVAGGFRYSLPENWKDTIGSLNFSNALPKQISLNHIRIMPSLLIDTNPKFPFQFTELSGYGNQLEFSLLPDRLIFNGELSMKADNATLNKVELTKPDLSVNSHNNEHKLIFSSLMDGGVFDGDAMLSTNKRLDSFTLNGYSINSELLSQWHLVENPIKSRNFSLKLYGNLSPRSLNGKMILDDKNITIQNNRVIDD